MRINKNKLSIIMAVVTMAAVVLPGYSYAHKGESESKENKTRVSIFKELGVRLSNNKENKGHDRQFPLPGLFYKGTVTATSVTGFTISTADNTVLTVDASSAKLIKIPRTVIALADVKTSDTVHITGTKSGSTIAASVVYVMPAEVKQAKAKGTVTAISDSTLTIQTKNDRTLTVNTDSSTEIKKDGQPAAAADIAIGSRVKLSGLWDSILNVFNALKIRIK